MSPTVSRQSREGPRSLLELNPPCDYCGKQGGVKKCTQCLSAYYCSKECQVGDWKKGGHKGRCKEFKAECEATAKRVVSEIGDESLPAHLRVQSLEELDREGPFSAADKAGLWPALEKLLVDDAAEVKGRFRPDSRVPPVSSIQWVANTLFRGQRGVRVDGKELQSFAKSDGARCAAFVASSQGAWDSWVDASVAVGRAVLQRETLAVPQLHAGCHRCARDTWVALSLALARPEFAHALFFVPLGPRAASRRWEQPNLSPGRWRSRGF